ncbi:MAG: hypothetical protein AB1752_04290 [Candidatus Zixiibacteriota bacterium]
MKPASMLTMFFLAIICLGHLLRLALGITVTIGANEAPMWISVAFALVSAALAVSLWRETRPK